jgi:hypothetical protein
MKNLEEQIINRLNKILNEYNLAIISKNNHNYKTTLSVDNEFENVCYTYALVEIFDNTIIECYLTWENIEFMLLDSIYNNSIFSLINITHKRVKYYNDFGLEPPIHHIVLNKLYNKLYFLNNCSCLEEFNIKMDLLGI